MHPTSRRLLNGLVLSCTAVVAMIVGHCSAHQIDAWVSPAVGGASPAVDVHAAHLAPAGVHDLHAGHVGHSLAAAGPHEGHGALLPMASGAFLLAVTAGLVLLLTIRHRGRLPAAPLRTLLAAQLFAFVVLEAAQRQLSPSLWAEAATDRRIWLGLALQPAVAWIVHRVGRRTAAAVAELLAAPTRSPLPGLAVVGIVPTPRLLGPAEGARRRALARGPPAERFLPT